MSRPIGFPAVGLSDGVVTVRLMAEADVPAVVEGVRDPDVLRYTTVPDPYDESDARHWLRVSRSGLETGTDLATVIADARSGRVIGAVGLHTIDPIHRRCSAGYWVAAEARGRGAGHRALRMLSEYAFAELGVKRIELWIEPGNGPSLRVAEDAGFTREGLLRSFMVVAGQRRDMLMYARLADGGAPSDSEPADRA